LKKIKRGFLYWTFPRSQNIWQKDIKTWAHEKKIYVVFNINLRFPYTLQGPKPPKWIDFALDEALLICRTRFSFSFYMAGRKRPTITNRKLEAASDLAT
jgi:hypothetical protein